MCTCVCTYLRATLNRKIREATLVRLYLSREGPHRNDGWTPVVTWFSSSVDTVHEKLPS